MKLSEIRDAYEVISGKLSDINRQLAFAGIGIIWIFRVSGSDEISSSVPKELLWPLIFLVVSLFLDVMQYFISTIIWYGVYCKNRKKNKSVDDEKIRVNEKEWWNIPSWICFILKLVALIPSYILMFLYVWDKLCI